jgi:tRNA/tmRNA/rRNA uracil-C5-methylase (TrmA/RlmC/RlmD family)
LLPAGYKLKGITLVDLFPQTYHLETVVRLEL